MIKIDPHRFFHAVMAVFCAMVLNACAAVKNETHKSHPQIINAGNDFKNFWKHAEGKSFTVQARLWDKEIESKYQNVYDNLLYAKKYDRNWKELKRKLLNEALPKIKDAYPQIAELFDTFDAAASEETAKFSKTFPDAKLDYPIYIIPSLYYFDGKAGTIDGQNVLAFGAEALVAYKRNLHILFSHEYFHIYHMSILGLDEKVFVEKARLSLPLWLEGMATYTSGIANAGCSDNELLFSDKLGELSSTEISKMAKDFAKVAGFKVVDKNDQMLYDKWFSAGYKGSTANRAGYRLGLEVVRHIAKTNDIHEMATWDLNKIHTNVIRALSEMSGTVAGDPGSEGNQTITQEAAPAQRQTHPAQTIGKIYDPAHSRRDDQAGNAANCKKRNNNSYPRCNWRDASAYCNGRLPSVARLKDAYRNECTGETRAESCRHWFWSAEEASAGYAHYVAFGLGGIVGANAYSYDGNDVRCD